MAGKPAEFGGWFILNGCARGLTEAAKLVGNPSRIEKGVLMAAIDCYGLGTLGDDAATDRAEQERLVTCLGRVIGTAAR